ncbi:probable maleylacetoacetate isomerase 2 [Thrips palmi]|uniref:Probable maleylacetoacetate isomerase 2 n=1 Tax=Thrips palmi TaxID=161013 RepID=A0A6P8ZZD9_THRPL|nr:probable maleylacetoacetate isomerase 2 [Thrips palmi]
MNSSKLPQLYSYWRSSCSYRVRIVLNLKEIDYNTVPIDIFKGGGEQFSDNYRQINPMKKVPALVIDGHTIVESLNIMQYLEETRPQKSLMPLDVLKRAKVREICEMIQSGIQPLQNVGVVSRFENFVKENQESIKLEWAQYWIIQGFTALNEVLTASAGKYCVGDDITLADCCLIPQVYNARKFKVDMQQFPNLSRVATHLENHPAFYAAHPSNQPDCPQEFKTHKI